MTSAPSPERDPAPATEEAEAQAAVAEDREESAAAANPGSAPSPGEAEPSEGARREAAGEEERVSDDLDELERVARERDEYLELAKRARADFDNYRKRAAREAADAGTRAKASLAAELVPAIDNLERALQAAGIEPEPGDAAEPPSREVSGQEAFARGVELVLGELQAALARAGVEVYDPMGEPFDPNFSEALSTRAVEGERSGVVVETLERGYRLDGQVIRPARVVVAE